MYRYSAIGIYVCRNKENGKCYVGQSQVAIGTRKIHHLTHLRRNIHYNRQWQEDFNNYGENAFEWDVLEEVDDKEKLDEREIYWIKKLNSVENGYNQSSGGKGAPRSN